MFLRCRSHRKDRALLSCAPDACQVLLRTFCTIFAQHPCYGRGASLSAFVDAESALVSSQVFSDLASSECEGKITLSLIPENGSGGNPWILKSDRVLSHATR